MLLFLGYSGLHCLVILGGSALGRRDKDRGSRLGGRETAQTFLHGASRSFLHWNTVCDGT